MNLDLDLQLLEDKPHFEKLYRIPAIYYRSWIEKQGRSIEGCRVLDFGCGVGLASSGLSLFCGAASVHGVDIGPDFEGCTAALHAIHPALQVPGNVRFERIPPAHPLPREAYDLLVSWSVLEHVNAHLYDQQMRTLYDALVPGGMACVQIAPLFHSPTGSHLFGLQAPWQHLTDQHDLLRLRVYSAVQDRRTADDLWECFVTLNKFTAEEFARRFALAGFEILDTYQTQAEAEPSAALLEIYKRSTLCLEQVLFVLRKPTG
jgi:trans-aconitate methyltransferase